MLPSRIVTVLVAALYVLSGVSQPLLMTLCTNAGLANHRAQLYMFFYYFGPATLVVTLKQDWPSRRAFWKAACISVWDLMAQALNYTGAAMAGSTIFAVIYSSITIWTALWSLPVLGRSLAWQQWLAILVVVGGLGLTALETTELGPHVKQGACLVLFGSSMHGGSYVFSEALMSAPKDKLSIRQNTAIQAAVATVILGVWQAIYTVPHFQEVLAVPALEAGTTLLLGLGLLGAFAGANLIHQWAFYHTLKHYPGGATSAGMMKGLQAVLVMLATHLFFCGRLGGDEMCFSALKCVSLVCVVAGVLLFGRATTAESNDAEEQAALKGYAKVPSIGQDSRVSSSVTVSTVDSEDPLDTEYTTFSLSV